MTTIIIVQARLNSSRLAGKVLRKINGKTIIELIAERLTNVKKISKVVFAIPNLKNNDILYNFLKKKNYNVFRGSNDNVLERYYKTAKKYSASTIIRLTADNPLVDHHLINKMLSKFFSLNKIDYLSNTLSPTYPDGIDVEIFTFEILKKALKNSHNNFYKEHVTPYFIDNDFVKKFNYSNKEDFSRFRFTIDEPKDLVFFKKLYQVYNSTKLLNWKNAVKICKNNKKIFKINSSILRNSGAKMNKNEKLWVKAKQLTPSGNSMISKHPDLFLANNWPTYFSRAKGCFVWDLEGTKFTDMSIMGVGTNILGYGNNKVDFAVKKTVEKGNLSTLNPPEEIELAEKLLNINKWADKAVFARTGGEANAIAIRLARAFSKKKKVLVCGYHGWHDWYLASNKKDEKKFRKEQLPFYNSRGVPSEIKGTLKMFSYNDYKQFESIIKKDKQIGIVKMEVIRNEVPKNNFLKKIRKLTKEKNIILIFDECTTGFRERFGGIYEKYNLEPDMVIYGKALGNGYAITAILGKNNIMKMYNQTFISSTFWTERIGFTAAIETLDQMQKNKTWYKITQIGLKIRKNWKKIAKKHNIKIKIYGIPSLSSFVFVGKDSIKYKAFFTQFMLKKKFLASTTIYTSIAHTDRILKKYFKLVDQAFKTIRYNKKLNHLNNIIEDYSEKKMFRILK